MKRPTRLQTRITLVALLAMLGSACTQQAVYNTAQGNRALECQKYPDSRYEECMATIEQDYESYRREREAAAAPADEDAPR